METTLLEQILTSPFGSFAFVLALLLGAGWLVHWVSMRIAQMQSKHDTFSDNVRDMKSDINEMRKDLSYLKGTIEAMKTNHQQAPVQAHSPLSPNETGRKIIKDLMLDEMIVRNADKIMSYLNANIGSRNPYDIQQFCIETASVELEKLFSESDIDKIKQYAFNHGQTLFYYGSLIGVLVRDLYFDRNGINPLEVDKHDPNK